MYEIVNSFLGIPVGVRFTIFLALIWILYRIFGRLLLKAIGLVLLLIRKLIYGLYLILEIPISALHGAVGGIFASIGQGLSNVFGKVHTFLDNGFKAFNKPKTIHAGKAFLVFLFLGAYLIIPHFAGLYSNIFTFWKDGYLEREERVIYLIEGTTRFADSVPTMMHVPAEDFIKVPAGSSDESAESAEIPPSLILEIPPGFSSLSRTDSGSYVTEIQLRLQELGFYDGPISGNFGPLTEEAVIFFQMAIGLEPTGILDTYVWIFLFSKN